MFSYPGVQCNKYNKTEDGAFDAILSNVQILFRAAPSEIPWRIGSMNYHGSAHARSYPNICTIVQSHYPSFTQKHYSACLEGRIFIIISISHFLISLFMTFVFHIYMLGIIVPQSKNLYILNLHKLFFMFSSWAGMGIWKIEIFWGKYLKFWIYCGNKNVFQYFLTK